MHEPDAPAWVSGYVKLIKQEKITMTEDEKKNIAKRLGKMIHKFLDKEPVVTNQDAIEVLGIATMYYHSFVYATGMVDYEEKP